jgi:hypothetical protein
MTTRSINQTTPGLTDAVEYIRRVVTLPPDPDMEHDTFPCCYTPELHTHEMMVAGDTGLAYFEMGDLPGPSYTVVHLPSGRLLNAGWAVESERLVQRWIAWLLQLADWTGPIPQVRQGYLFETFALTCAGILVDPLLDDDPEAFDPMTQVQFAASLAEGSER